MTLSPVMRLPSGAAVTAGIRNSPVFVRHHAAVGGRLAALGLRAAASTYVPQRWRNRRPDRVLRRTGALRLGRCPGRMPALGSCSHWLELSAVLSAWAWLGVRDVRKKTDQPGLSNALKRIYEGEEL